MKKFLLNVAAALVLGTAAGPAMAQKEATPADGQKTPPAEKPAAEPAKKTGPTAFDKLGTMIAGTKMTKAKKQRDGSHSLAVGLKGKWTIDVTPSVNDEWVWLEFCCIKVEPGHSQDAKWLKDLTVASMSNGIASFVIEAKTDLLFLKMAVPVKGLDAASLEDFVDQLTEKADFYRPLWDTPAPKDVVKK